MAHGGSLWLHDRPGGGLSARVILPLQQQPAGRHLATWLGAALTAALLLVSAPPGRTCRRTGRNCHRYPAPQPTSRTLVIAGPTDTPVVAPLIQGFQSLRPDVTVVYREISSRDLYEATIDGRLTNVDVLMSSASDLQIRLANDGYAQSYASPYASKLPSWAVWRNEVYGFTFEPAVIVYNPKRFTEATVPAPGKTCCACWNATKPALQGRVGTYDIAASSLGYLLAEQDELVSSNFWGWPMRWARWPCACRPPARRFWTPSKTMSWTLATTSWVRTRCRARRTAARSAWCFRRTTCWCWRVRC